MRITKTRCRVLAAAVFAVLLALTAGAFAFGGNAHAAGNVVTAATETTTADGLVRAVKVENDSFTVHYKNDCGNGQSNWGFAFSNSPDTPLGLGDSGATKNALDILIQGENFNVYNNNGWSECTAILMENQGAGWMLSPYSVNKPTHLTISKADGGGIRIACYSDGGNSWATEGSVAGVNDWKNGKTLCFDDLVDENGYTYWRVAPNGYYPITITDNRTTVTGITYENARDVSRVSIVGAKDAAGKSLYVADPQVVADGYSFVCEDAATLGFSDGENTVWAAVGENVVFPKINYSVDNAYKLGGAVMSGPSDRFSVGDSAYGMIDVAENGVKFDLGVEATSLPSGNVNFNICIGPNTAVQAPAQQNMPAGVFSIFTTVTTEGHVAVAFYDGNWTQHTGDVEVASLSVGTLNRLTVEIKKDNDAWGLYIAGRKLEGSHGGNTFDFNALIGSSFMNAQRKSNIAVVGWSAPSITASLLGTKIEVDAAVSSVYNADFYADINKAYDAAGGEVPVFQTSVTETGYSFVTLKPNDIVKTEFVTRGGVTTEAETDVAGKTYADTIVLGDDAHDKTVTVVNDSGIKIPDADVAIKEGETDVSRYYEIVNNTDGTYTLKGVQKAVTVRVAHTENGKPATKEEVISSSVDSVTVTLEFFGYSYTSELYKTLDDDNRLFTTGKIYAGRGAGISLKLSENIQGSAGLQLFFSDAPFSDANFVDNGNGPENLDGERNGIRIIALKSDNYLYIDILSIVNGDGSNLTDCDYIGEAGKVRLDLRPDERHTFSLIGNGLYIDGTLIYEWNDALWLTDDDSCYIGTFLSRGYAESFGSGTLQVYADTIAVENVSFSGVTDGDFDGMRFIGRDSAGNLYELSSLTIDAAARSYVASGFNIGHKIAAVDVYTAGGVKATLSLEAEEVVFGSGHTLTVNVNMPISAADVTVCDSDGNDITRYLKLSVADSTITVSGVQNKTFVVTVAKENMEVARATVAVAEEDVTESLTLVRAKYTVTLDLKSANASLTGMENNIKVYPADDDTSPLNVTVTYEGGKYVIAGIEKGTAVKIVFAADGYTSDSVGATDTAEISMVVSRIYSVTFTVKAGDNYLTSTQGITVKGANDGVELKHNGTAFVIEGLTREIRVTVEIEGYEAATQDFDADNTQAEIVLTAKGTDNPNPGDNTGDNNGDNNGDNQGGDAKPDEGCGCGGSVAANAGMGAIVLVGAAALLISKRRLLGK